MYWKTEWKPLLWITGAFLVFLYLPVGMPRFDNAIMEALRLAKWYAQEHVLLCLVPAFFIAGAIAVFISQASVMKYLGPAANKALAYGVSSVSGSILAVCSCTVLPLFSGIYRMGAGLGPATAFLYSGPAINVLAIILTARVLGLEIGIARAVGAVLFSIVIGLIMHLIYRKEETEKAQASMNMPATEVTRPLWQNALFFASMVGILVFANWGAPREFHFTMKEGRHLTAVIVQEVMEQSSPNAVIDLKITEGHDTGKKLTIKASNIQLKEPVSGFSTLIWKAKWLITAFFSAALALILIFWLNIQWWKVTAVAVPITVLTILFPGKPTIAFVSGIVGLSIIISADRGESGEWFSSSWDFTKQILPLLLIGVLIAGAFLGRPGHEGLIPREWVNWAVGGNSIWANAFASVAGAFMYFATLTEVPIVQGLISSGMGKGPALALLLAGPALSLPNMLVIHSVIGTRKTLVFIALVCVMATISGMIFGALF